MQNDKIKEWACSFSGCDGGNVDADTWLCGIEWGAGSEDYREKLKLQINNGAVEISNKKFDWTDSITYPYGISFAKLYQAIHGEKVENYKNVTQLDGSELFKLNLYPIAFNSTDKNLWQKNNMNEITGFENKHLFNTWCVFNRFPFFSKLREKKKPKLIICTGVDYLRDFLMFFLNNQTIQQIKLGKLSPKSVTNSYERTFYHVKTDKTLIVIIPFFSGRYGLNSNYLLQEMGKEIKKLLN